MGNSNCSKWYLVARHYLMQQYKQHIPMTDMGLFSLATAELESSSFCLSAVSPGVTDGGNRCSLHSEMTLLSAVKYCCSWQIYGP